MSSAVITYYKYCTCGAPLSLWQYDMETSDQTSISKIDDIGFTKMCCRMRLLSRPMPYVTDYMADMRVIEDRNGTFTRERGYVVDINVPLP